MSLRAHPVVAEARLPDGRVVSVRVGVPDDPYIARRDLDTVVAELREVDGGLLGVVSTILDAEDESKALALARELAGKLESGELEPTAGAIESLADEFPEERSRW